MNSLVIHPRFTVYGGGELLSLYVCKILQEEGYRVGLVCDSFKPEVVREIYGRDLGKVMASCEHIKVPTFRPLLNAGLAFQRTLFAGNVSRALKNMEPDVAFSTQSSLYNVKEPLFHFVYDIADLFAYPDRYTHTPLSSRKKIPYYAFLRILRKIRQNPKVTWFFALSNTVLKELKRRNYNNSSLIYPPCQLSFNPGKKKKRVIQVTRLVPQKRLEWFFEIARRLPEYEFVLVGRNDEALQRFNPGYSQKLFLTKPENVMYVESPIRKVSYLLEESKVYLYTGLEPGMGIAMMEAIGAGCYPISPSEGGGSDVLDAVRFGGKFSSVLEACHLIREVMNSNHSPERISKMAKEVFSAESFESQILGFLDGIA